MSAYAINDEIELQMRLDDIRFKVGVREVIENDIRRNLRGDQPGRRFFNTDKVTNTYKRTRARRGVK